MKNVKVIELTKGYRVKWTEGNSSYSFDYEFCSFISKQLTHTVIIESQRHVAIFNESMIEQYYPGLLEPLLYIIEEFKKKQPTIESIRNELKIYNNMIKEIKKRKNKEDSNPKLSTSIEISEKKLKDQYNEIFDIANKTLQNLDSTTMHPIPHPKPLIPYKVEFALYDTNSLTIACSKCEAICLKPEKIAETEYLILCPLCYRKKVKMRKKRQG